jgi:hypothetical protein
MKFLPIGRLLCRGLNNFALAMNRTDQMNAATNKIGTPTGAFTLIELFVVIAIRALQEIPQPIGKRN